VCAPLRACSSDCTRQACLEFSRRKFFHGCLLRFAAHSLSETLVSKQPHCVLPQFQRVIGKKSANPVLDRRCRVTVAENGKSGGHCFKHRQVVSIFQPHIRGMHEEPMAAHILFQLRPVVRRSNAGHIVVVASDSDRKTRKCLPVKISEQSAGPPVNMISDTQAACDVAAARKIDGCIHGARKVFTADPHERAFKGEMAIACAPTRLKYFAVAQRS